MIKFNPKDDSEYLPISILWRKEIGIIKNIQYIFLELIFAKQIVQLMSNTASVAKEEEIGAYGDVNAEIKGPIIGQVSRIEKFIPASFMTKLMEIYLVELLAIKYVGHYKFLVLSNGKEYQLSTKESFDLTKLEFRANKAMSYQFTSYLGKIDFIFLLLETISVTLTWIFTHSLEASLVVAGVFEFVRRFKI